MSEVCNLATHLVAIPIITALSTLLQRLILPAASMAASLVIEELSRLDTVAHMEEIV